MAGDVHNEFFGTAHYVVQARDISGDIHLYAAPGATRVERAADELASLVHVQWRYEARRRGLGGPVGLAVPWTAQWQGTAQPADPHRTGISSAGQGLAQLVDAFRALPVRRLAVLGPPAAGKSSLLLLLTLELLRTRASEDPVPVILLMSGWDPAVEYLDVWITRRITEDYAGRAPDLDRHSIERLVRDRRVLPVLDGLDELPGGRRGAALAGLNRSLGQEEPVIFSSRTAEYDAATRREHGVHSAAVVHARPVPAREAGRYLLATAHPRRRTEWRAVVDELDTHPDGPVSTALSSPLGLWLASSVYAGAGMRPAALTDERHFPEAGLIEEHLLDGLPRAVFAHSPLPDRIQPLRQWDTEKATRWLRFLAVHLDRALSRDFEWWRVRGPALGPAALIIAVLVAPALTLLAAAPVIGIVTGPALFDAELSATQRSSVDVAVLGALFIGFIGGLLAAHRDHASANQPRRPASLKAGVVAATALALVTVGGIVGGGIPSVVVGILLPTLFRLGLTRRVSSDSPIGPKALLRGERRTALMSACLIAPAIALLTGVLVANSAGTVVVVVAAGWFPVAVTLLVQSRWGRWTILHGILALRGRLPWKTMAFLEDAGRLGVLRRVGGVYQFRHARLQERLAGRRTNDSGTATDPPDEVRISSTNKLDSQTWLYLYSPLAVLAVLFLVVMPLAAGKGIVEGVGMWVDGVRRMSGVDQVLFFVPLLLSMATSVWMRHQRDSSPEELRVTAEGIERSGPAPLRIAWAEVYEVSLLRPPVMAPLKALASYCLVIRIFPGLEPPPKAKVLPGRWIVLWHLGKNPDVPPDLSAALSRFAGSRWHHLPR